MNIEQKTTDFYKYTKDQFPKVSILISKWVKRNKIPIHPQVKGYPKNIYYVKIFLTSIGIISNVEPRYFSCEGSEYVEYDWYFRNVGSEEYVMITNDNPFSDETDAMFHMIHEIFDIIEKV